VHDHGVKQAVKGPEREDAPKALTHAISPPPGYSSECHFCALSKWWHELRSGTFGLRSVVTLPAKLVCWGKGLRGERQGTIEPSLGEGMAAGEENVAKWRMAG